MATENISCSIKRPLGNSSVNGPKDAKKKKFEKITMEEYAKARIWIIGKYKPTTKDSFVSIDEIDQAFSNAHPMSNLRKASGWIKKTINTIWTPKQVYLVQRIATPGKARVRGYAGLARKIPEVKDLTSVVGLPKKELVFPGWTVEYLENPAGLRYRKSLTNRYLDKQPITIELNLSYANDNAADYQLMNSWRLNATVLCRGAVVQCHKTGIWDSNSIPIWARVENLLTFLDSSPICFGFELPNEPWFDESSISRRKIFSLYENINEVMANEGKKRQVSTECELLLIEPGSKVCRKCSKMRKHESRKISRHQKVDEKVNVNHKNQRYMSRGELKNRIKELNEEVRKLRKENARMKEKLEEDSSSSDDDDDRGDDAEDKDEVHDGEGSSKGESDDEDSSDDDSDDDDDEGSDGDDDNNGSDNQDIQPKCQTGSNGDLPVQCPDECETESLEGLTKVVISNLTYIENIFD